MVLLVVHGTDTGPVTQATWLVDMGAAVVAETSCQTGTMAASQMHAGHNTIQ